MNFNQYDWHDAIIKLISIDRNKPGVNDKITFEIEWEDRRKSILEFEEVYWASMLLNFGIVAEETILNAQTLNKDDTDLVNFYTSWNNLLNDTNLTAYLIELNSTGSIIKIIAKRYIISDL